MQTAGRLLRLTPRRIQQLVKEGWIKQAARGSFRVVDLVHGYLDFRDEADRNAQRSTAHAEVQKARAQEINHRMAIKNRDLIALDDAIAGLDAVVGEVTAEFAGLAAKVTRDLVLRREIEREVNGALNRISERLRKASDALETGGDAFAASGDNGPGPVGGEE